MTGRIGILNVGAGDTKLIFDKDNPAEVIRSGRIVTDMLRRGYALMIAVDDGKGGKVYQRATQFNEKTSEYIIADFDPLQAAAVDEAENNDPQTEQTSAPATGETASPAPGRKRSTRTRAIPADQTTGVAIARSAGG